MKDSDGENVKEEVEEEEGEEEESEEDFLKGYKMKIGNGPWVPVLAPAPAPELETRATKHALIDE